MARTTFTRFDGELFSMPPGRWTPITDDGQKTDGFCCPVCGQRAGIASHEIDQYGNVHPSVVCSAKDQHEDDSKMGKTGCDEKGFHEYIRLEDWTP